MRRQMVGSFAGVLLVFSSTSISLPLEVLGVVKTRTQADALNDIFTYVPDGGSVCLGDYSLGHRLLIVEAAARGDSGMTRLYSKKNSWEGKFISYDQDNQCWVYSILPYPAGGYCQAAGEFSTHLPLPPVSEGTGSRDIKFVFHPSSIETIVHESTINLIGGSISLYGGDGQTVLTPINGSENVPIPLAVQLIHCDGRPVGAGIDVDFEITDYPGELNAGLYGVDENGAELWTTDAQGIARRIMYLHSGSEAGNYTVRATSGAAPGFEINFNVQARGDQIPPSQEEHEEDVGDEEDCNAYAGDPISLINGNNFQTIVDFPAHEQSLLKFTRYYNSFGSPSRIFKNYWSSTYDRFIWAPTRDVVKLRRHTGETIVFDKVHKDYVAREKVGVSLIETRSGWEFIDTNGTLEIYDDLGRLVTIQDLSGRRLDLVYNDSSDPRVPTQVISNDGKAMYLYYNSKDALSLVRVGSSIGGRFEADYEWGRDFHLVGVSYTSGIRERYEYTDLRYPHALTARYATDSSGQDEVLLASWGYDAAGRAVSFARGDGADAISISYDSATDRTVTDALGNTTKVTLTHANSYPRVGVIAGPGCQSSEQFDLKRIYNSSGYLVSQTQYGIETVLGGYDSKGQPAYRIDAPGTPEERRFDYQYDPRFVNKLTSITTASVFPGGEHTWSITYNDAGDFTEIREDGYTPSGTPITRTTRFVYGGPFGQLTEVDGPLPGAGDTIRYTYGGGSRLISVQGPTGTFLRSNMQYDEIGNLVSEVRPGNVVYAYEYLPGSRQLTAIQKTQDGSVERMEWTYDAFKVPTSVRVIENGIEKYVRTYDIGPSGRVIGIDNSRTAFVRDAMGNILRLENRDPTLGTIQRWLERRYDGYSRLEKLIDPKGTTNINFDKEGRLTSILNAKQGLSEFFYDARNRAISATYPDSSTRFFAHGPSDNLSFFQAGNSVSTTLNYDDFGRLVKEASADTGQLTLTMNAVGNPKSITRADGLVESFHYDSFGRTISVERFGTVSDLVTSYGDCGVGDGPVCRLDRSNGEFLEYTYTSQTEIASITSPTGTVAFSYDPLGQLSTLTYPSGRTVQYIRNSHNRIVMVKLIEPNGTERALVDQITYLPHGPRTSWVLGNGLSEQFTYDATYDLVSSELIGIRQTTILQRDAHSNPLQIDRDGTATTFQFDSMDRLISFTSNGVTTSIGYDANGNRDSVTEGATIADYVYAPGSNRLTARGSESWAYDDAGRVVAISGPNRNLKLIRNGIGQVVTITDGQTAPNTLSTFQYDPLEQLAELGDGLAVTRFMYGPFGDLLVTFDPATGSLNEFVYLHGLPVLVMSSNGAPGPVHWIHNNETAAPVLVTDESGQVIWEAHYMPFGDATVNNDPDGNGVPFKLNLRFPGQWQDLRTGLVFNYSRLYDPETGRYLAPDRTGLWGGPNRYIYAAANPLRFVDPLGLDVTIARYDGEWPNKFGHVGGGVNTDETSGFYGDDSADLFELLNGTFPGQLRRDDPERLIESIVIPTTPEQDAAFRQVLEAYRRGAYGNYDLNDHNCVTAMLRALSAAGIHCPDTIAPRYLMIYLKSRMCR